MRTLVIDNHHQGRNQYTLDIIKNNLSLFNVRNPEDHWLNMHKGNRFGLNFTPGHGSHFIPFFQVVSDELLGAAFEGEKRYSYMKKGMLDAEEIFNTFTPWGDLGDFFWEVLFDPECWSHPDVEGEHVKAAHIVTRRLPEAIALIRRDRSVHKKILGGMPMSRLLTFYAYLTTTRQISMSICLDI